MKKIIFVHIKILRGNYFLLISDHLQRLIFNKSCGIYGFKNIEKRTSEAFDTLLFSAIHYLNNFDSSNHIYLKIEGASKELLYQISSKFIKYFQNHVVKLCILKLINKVAHNGCRKIYFRK